MDIARDVYDILKSYYEEREHSKNYQTEVEKIIERQKKSDWAPWFQANRPPDDVWTEKVHPLIVTRRMALVRDNAFRNALEVFLQLRFGLGGEKTLEDIMHKMPEVYAALVSVINPTEEQLWEIRTYNRMRTQ